MSKKKKQLEELENVNNLLSMASLIEKGSRVISTMVIIISIAISSIFMNYKIVLLIFGIINFIYLIVFTMQFIWLKKKIWKVN